MIKIPARAEASNSESGYTLVEVLVASVIFAGVFLMMFTMLGRVLANSSGAEQIRVASIVKVRIAQFHERVTSATTGEFIEIDGARYHILSAIEEEKYKSTLHLTIIRESISDTLGEFYAVRYDANE